MGRSLLRRRGALGGREVEAVRGARIVLRLVETEALAKGGDRAVVLIARVGELAVAGVEGVVEGVTQNALLGVEDGLLGVTQLRVEVHELPKGEAVEGVDLLVLEGVLVIVLINGLLLEHVNGGLQLALALEDRDLAADGELIGGRLGQNGVVNLPRLIVGAARLGAEAGELADADRLIAKLLC